MERSWASAGARARGRWSAGVCGRRMTASPKLRSAGVGAGQSRPLAQPASVTAAATVLRARQPAVIPCPASPTEHQHLIRLSRVTSDTLTTELSCSRRCGHRRPGGACAAGPGAHAPKGPGSSKGGPCTPARHRRRAVGACARGSEARSALPGPPGARRSPSHRCRAAGRRPTRRGRGSRSRA